MSNCCTFEYTPENKDAGKTFTICGVSDSDHIFNKIRKAKSFYEIDLLEYIFHVIRRKKEGVCIDVGANIGNHSIFLGEYVSSEIISVEANSDVLSVLRENLETNIKNFEIYNCALGATEGKAIVSVPENAEDNIGMAKVDYVDDTDVAQNLVEVKTLDRVVDEFQAGKNKPKVSLIKIDVEGAEVDVLCGATKTLIKYHPDLFIEAASKEFRDEIEKILRPLDYRRMSRWAGTPVYHYAYKPSLKLYVRVLLYKLKKKVNKRN